MSKQSHRKKRKMSAGFRLLLLVGVVTGLLIAGNSLFGLSEDFPTWDSLKQDWEAYAEENPAKKSIDPNEARIHLIDVGQGSCVLIQQGNYAALLDAGEADQGEKVVSYLKSQQVERLDFVLASHPHSDHIGGMATVLQTFPVDKLVMPKIPKKMIPTTRVYENMLNAIQEQQIPVLGARVGEQYKLGDGTLTILGPTGEFDDLNNMSVAVRYTYEGKSFLFTADMEAEAEEGLLATGETLTADVYVLGHHGSRTSSSEALLQKIAPTSFFVIQVGYENRYRHPHQEALARVEAVGGEVLRTDLEGTIVIAFPSGSDPPVLRSRKK